jgi:hypothetical protein
MKKTNYLLILLFVNFLNINSLRADQSTATLDDQNILVDYLEDSVNNAVSESEANLHDEIFGPSQEIENPLEKTRLQRIKNKIKNFFATVALYILIKMIDAYDSLPSIKIFKGDSNNNSDNIELDDNNENIDLDKPEQIN